MFQKKYYFFNFFLFIFLLMYFSIQNENFNIKMWAEQMIERNQAKPIRKINHDRYNQLIKKIDYKLYIWLLLNRRV